MKKILFSALFLLSFSKINFAQNVGINTTGAAADVSAILDILATNKGMLIPRVALTTTTDAVTIATPATSLMVYNTATAGISPNNVVPGFYYNSGTSGAPIWTRFANGNGTSWLLTGNAGTNIATNFIGTTDAVDWAMRTNNLERMRITSAGNVGIGTTTPGESFSVVKTQAGWQGRFNNSSGVGADVYLSHGSGYGMHIRGWNATDFVYALEMYNNTSLTNAFYNSGRVLLGNVGNVGVGVGITAPAVKLAVNGNGTNVYATDAWIENNMHVQGNEVLTVGGRGRMRVGTAWGYVGLYAEGSSGGLNNDLVLGASSGTTRVGCNGCTTQNLLVNGSLTVYPTSNTFNRIISGGAGSYLGIYTDALYTGTASAPTFLWDGMTLSSVGTTFGDISYSSENPGGWHYWMIGGNRWMRLDEFGDLMLNFGTYFTTGADVAEEFTHGGGLEEGDVVMIDAEGSSEIKKCDKPKSSKVFGVISTEPGLLLNNGGDEEFENIVAAHKPKDSKEREQMWLDYKNAQKKKRLPVALNGRTPCKVVATAGAIKKGDFITSSSQPGYGEKLVGPGSYFGIALEDDNGTGKIMIAVKSGYTNE